MEAEEGEEGDGRDEEPRQEKPQEENRLRKLVFLKRLFPVFVSYET